MKKPTIFLLILLAIFFTSTLYLLYFNFKKSSITTSTYSPTTGVIPTETISSKTPAIIPSGWKKTEKDFTTNPPSLFTLAYPSTWFFSGLVLTNYDANSERSKNPAFLPTDVKCDVVTGSESENSVLTDLTDIAQESLDSYKIVRGNQEIETVGNIVTYQLSSNNQILANVYCYAFSETSANTVDQIVKTIRL